MRLLTTLMIFALTLGFWGCSEDESTPEAAKVELKNYSVTPVMLKNLMPGLTVYSLIASDDVLPQSAGYVFGGSPDGAGLLKNSDGTYTYILSHEDNFAIGRVTLDKTFKPIKGEYLVKSDEGLYRLCSGSMATPAEHGFGPLFISCGESSAESQILGINPYGTPGTAHQYLTALGRWSGENAVPLPKDAYPGKTVIIIGDDDSGPSGGQVALYVANTGDLTGGKLYALARVDNDTTEKNIVIGQTYDVEFRQIMDQTAQNLNPQCDDLKTIRFSRTEDLDYQKGGGNNSRNIYFNCTGQDKYPSRTKYGRMYRLVMDANNPLKGKLELLLDGDDKSGPAKEFQDPDNICVTRNYVYIQEDPNGYGDEDHDSYIYQYNIATKEVKVVMEIDPFRGVANPNNAGTVYDKADSKFGTAEYGALIDISDIIGVPDVFLLNIQPHGWRGDKYKNPDKGTLRPNENQAGQVVIIKGLPR